MSGYRGYACVGLVGVKKEQNFGGVMRAAHCFGAGLIVLQSSRLPAVATNTSRAERHIPTMLTDDVCKALPHDCETVAVELVDGAISLVDFVHPQRAMYVFGPEDGSVPASIVAECRHVVQVPTAICMNLAAAVNVVLYDRMAKQSIARRLAA